MRAEKFSGCLAAVTIVMLTVVACSPIVRRTGGGQGGSGSGGDPAGGTTGTGGSSATGGTTETGGTAATGGTEAGGTTATGGVNATGGSSASGGMTDTGGTTEVGGTTATGGVAKTGGTTGGGSIGGTTSTVCGVATSYGWASTPSLMDAVGDGSHSLVAIRSPSVVYTSGKYHVFATVVNSAGSANMQHIQFADWPNASSATVDFFDNYSGFTGSRSQPQIFYFTAKKTWYLITQSGAPAYSTNPDLSQTAAWTKPATFYSGTPAIVTQNAGSGGIGWTDFWIICDSATCYMFFTNQKGYLFRSQTTASNFPNSFGDPVVVMQSSYLVEGGRIYKVNGASQFLMLVEGTGSGGRYIGAWSATALDGKWTALAETEANPFAGAANTTFSGTKWTKDVGHGELIRSTTDETMTVDNCNMRYLYAGRDPYTSASAALYPWKLGLLVRSK